MRPIGTNFRVMIEGADGRFHDVATEFEAPRRVRFVDPLAVKAGDKLRILPEGNRKKRRQRAAKQRRAKA